MACSFVHSLHIVYALSALARRVCAIRTLSCRLLQWACHLKRRSEQTLGHSWIGCGRDKKLNVRDTIIAAKKRFLYLTATLSIDEQQKKRLDEAKEQERAIPPQRMTQRNVWVFEWLTRIPEFEQKNNLPAKVHKEVKGASKISSEKLPQTSPKRCRGMACTATHWDASSRNVTTSSRTVGAKFTTRRSLNFVATKILNI